MISERELFLMTTSLSALANKNIFDSKLSIPVVYLCLSYQIKDPFVTLHEWQ